jgi:hypothetical protein
MLNSLFSFPRFRLAPSSMAVLTALAVLTVAVGLPAVRVSWRPPPGVVKWRWGLTRGKTLSDYGMWRPG